MAAGFAVDLVVIVPNGFFAAACKQSCVVADIFVGDRLVSRCVGCLLFRRRLGDSLLRHGCLRCLSRFVTFEHRGQPDEERRGDHHDCKDDRNARFLKEFHACSF